MNIIFSYRINTGYRLFFLFAATLLSTPSQSQQGKSVLKLADEYFAAGEYLTAASLYAQTLQRPNVQNPVSEFPINIKHKRATATVNSGTVSTIQFKQAESYRLSNNWEAAVTSYMTCAGQNSPNRTDALFWLAICQRNLGQYHAAEETLNELLKVSTTAGEFRKLVVEELQRLDYIKQQLARPDSILFRVQKLNLPLSNDRGAFAPVHVTGNQFIITTTITDSVIVKGINPYHSRLIIGTIKQSTMEESKPLILSSSGYRDNQGAASMSSDGNYLYYTQWKIEKGKTISSIYYTVKVNGNWSAPRLVPLVNLKGYNSKQPFCSPDGKYLYFASDRPGGSGKFDIWYATLNKDGSTGEPVNAGQIINTMGDEAAPFYHNSSSTLVFSSNSLKGMGGYDLFTSKQHEATWSVPENMGYPLNSVRDDIYFYAPENTPLLSNAMISSDRGSGCCLESYSIAKRAKKQELSGIVKDLQDSMPISDAVITLKNTSGKTRQFITDANGSYSSDQSFENYSDWIVRVNKESYKEVTTSLLPKKINQEDPLTDRWVNEDIYMEQNLVIKADDIVTVYFEFDRSILNRETSEKLDSIYKSLLNFPTATIQISGYADNSGTLEYNKKLSDKRAKACSDYFVSKGIDAGRITFESFGACCPVVMELVNLRDNIDTRSLDRRALIHVKK